jgi:hypothetical protein
VIYPLPPPPLAIGIMGLGGNSRKIFESKGLIAKFFENQSLIVVKEPKNGLGELRGLSWER